MLLKGNQLTGLPAEIGQLTSLETLGLENNQLTSVPVEIGQLTSLTVLGLLGNKLTRVPAEFMDLTSLKQLGLNNNQLSEEEHVKRNREIVEVLKRRGVKVSSQFDPTCPCCVIS